MTHLTETARGRDILSRWCILAEQRLQYLTDLFESERWRRYYSEVELLENIREAKSAVAVWRELSVREGARDNSGIDVSWLGRRGVTLLRDRGEFAQPERPEIAAKPPAAASSIEQAVQVCADEAPTVPAVEPSSKPALATTLQSALAALPERASESTLDIAVMQLRYPLLRSAMF